MKKSYSVRLCFIFALFLFPFAGITQIIEGGDLVKNKQVLIRPPQSYSTPLGKVEGLNAKRITSGEGKWIVFSDRDDNPTFSDKNCTKKNINLHFMEAFVVAQETEDALRLVRFDPSSQPFEDKPGKKSEFIFKASAEDVGWIKKKNLLLWNKALVDDTTHYTIKAISVKKLNSKDGGSLAKMVKKGILDLYTFPSEENHEKYDAGKDITLFQYFFVLKQSQENGMVLLGKVNKIRPSTISDDVLGWAPVSQLQIWDNAVCLRINFADDAIQERKEKNIDIQFFKDIASARNFRDGKVADHLPFVYNDPTVEANKKDNPYFYGFPIIEKQQKEANIYRTGYVTQTVDRNGNSVFSASKQAKLNQLFEEIKNNYTQVNLVFVLDGSQRAFFKTIASALRDMSYLGGGKDVTRNTYKIGAVIYNDAKCEEEPFKVLSLMTSKDNFVDKLSDEADKTPTCQLDRNTNGAPTYAALKKAGDMFDKANETNLIIFMGTTSDPDKSQRQAALDALISKQVKLNIFQLMNKDGALYDDFIRDGRFFLEKNAAAFDAKHFKDEIKSGKRVAAKLIPSDTYAYLENSGTPGTFAWKDAGESFQSNDISKKIIKLVKENESKMNELLSRYDHNTTGAERGIKDLQNEEQTKQLMALFQDKGYSDKDIESLASEQNFQLFIEAYATTYNKNLSEPILNRTLFVTRGEYQSMTESFGRLEDSYSSSNVREGILNTYKEIILKYKGGEMKDVENFTPNEFMKLVTGLSNISNNPLFNRSLSDLNNVKKTSDEDISKLKSTFFNIDKKLKEVKKDKTAILDQDDETFYWIPETVFHVSN